MNAEINLMLVTQTMEQGGADLKFEPSYQATLTVSGAAHVLAGASLKLDKVPLEIAKTFVGGRTYKVTITEAPLE